MIKHTYIYSGFVGKGPLIYVEDDKHALPLPEGIYIYTYIHISIVIYMY